MLIYKIKVIKNELNASLNISNVNLQIIGNNDPRAKILRQENMPRRKRARGRGRGKHSTKEKDALRIYKKRHIVLTTLIKTSLTFLIYVYPDFTRLTRSVQNFTSAVKMARTFKKKKNQGKARGKDRRVFGRVLSMPIAKRAEHIYDGCVITHVNS